MTPKQLLLFTSLLICASFHLNAQTALSSHNFIPVTSPSETSNEHFQNFVKLNLTALPLKNYSLQYERVLKKSISVALSFRTMPTTTLPFRNAILDALDDEDPDTREVFETVKLSNIAITPEVRWYVGKKGYGQGFYIAPFYRYASFSISTFQIDYEINTDVGNSLNLPGKLTTNTGGLMFGAQWSLGKRLCLDWWILGPHFGSGKGEFTGTARQPLSEEEQNYLREELEDLDIPFSDKTVSVTANGASLKLNGPWAGVRAGISFGFKF